MSYELSAKSNISEGTQGSNLEFRRFLDIANGTNGEVHAQTIIAIDVDLLDGYLPSATGL